MTFKIKITVKKPNISNIGRISLSDRVEILKSVKSISEDSNNLCKIKVNKIIWGDSEIKVAHTNCLLLRLKKTPEKFLIINGNPGINRKIT